MALEIGATARLKQPVIQGEIIDTQFNKGLKQLEHLVSYEDADGEIQQRWFLESDLEEVGNG